MLGGGRAEICGGARVGPNNENRRSRRGRSSETRAADAGGIMGDVGERGKSKDDLGEEVGLRVVVRCKSRSVFLEKKFQRDDAGRSRFFRFWSLKDAGFCAESAETLTAMGTEGMAGRAGFGNSSSI